MARTSASDPIRIADVPYPDSSGLIGVTFCPGKKQRNGMSGHWHRDLTTDLNAIAAWGASTVITLVEDSELVELGVAPLASEVLRRKMRWLHLPIVDRCAPDAAWDRQWSEIRRALHDDLHGGQRILVHCKGGLGRAGTVAARLLIEAGMSPPTAITTVRKHRPRAIETVSQEQYVLSAHAVDHF